GQYETLIGTPNLAYSGLPLLMIVLYCLSLLQRNVTARYGAVLVLNFLLIYTGFGIFMGVVTVGLFALELYWSFRSRTAVPLALAFAALLIAVISLASFFIRYVWAPAVDCFVLPRHRLWLYPWFMSAKAIRRHLVFALLVSSLLIPPVPTPPWFADGKRAWAECYKKIADIHACDSTAKFPIYPGPEATGLQQKLDFLQQHHLNL